MTRGVLFLALACAACGGGDDGVSQRVRYERLAAVRAGLNVVKASPGGPLAKFDNVRLIGKDVVCGTVDAQDGDGARRFGVAKGELTVEQPGKPETVAAIARICTGGPVYKVVGHNTAYTDIDIEDAPTSTN